MNNHVFIIL